MSSRQDRRLSAEPKGPALLLCQALFPLPPLVLFPEPSAVCSLVTYILFSESLGQDRSYQLNILGDFVSQLKNRIPGMVRSLGTAFLVPSSIRGVHHVSVSIYGFWKQHHRVKFLPPPWTGFLLLPQTEQGISSLAGG